MNNEKILEIARRHMSLIEGELDGGTVTYWEFWEEELLAFAQAIIKARLAENDQPEKIDG